MLCVSLSLLIGFSVTANATDISGYTIRQDIYLMTGNTILEEYWAEFTPNNNQEETDTWSFDSYVINTAIQKNYYYRNVWNIFFDEYPFELNKVNRVSLENYYWAYLINQTNGTMIYGRGLSTNDTISVVLEFTDGTSETVVPSASTDSDHSLDISFDFKPTKNVSRMTIIIDSPLSQYFTVTTNRFEMTGYLGEIKGDTKHNFNLDIQSEEAGLLSGLIGWVQNIFNKIGDIADSIARLPSTIWNAFYNGLTDFILPADGWWAEFIDLVKATLEERLGAFYQINEYGYNLFSTLDLGEVTTTIHLPKTTIDLCGTPFSFGGYDVLVVPQGFEWLASTIKTITGIAGVCAFALGFKRRIERLVGNK